MKLTDSNLKVIVWSITIIIPVVVTLLAYLPPLDISPETAAKLYILPKMNAFLNGTAFFALLGAWIAIRSGNIKLHRALTSTAVGLSVLFLLSYIVFHFTTAPTRLRRGIFNEDGLLLHLDNAYRSLCRHCTIGVVHLCTRLGNGSGEA